MLIPVKRSSNTKQKAITALFFLVPAPSIGVLMAMYLTPGALGQAVFMFTKIWLILFPLAWIWKMTDERITIPKLSTKGMKVACLSGLLIFITIGICYLFLKSQGAIDSRALSQKAMTLGLGSPTFYILAAIYWCTVNSLIEEYVWRWFVFTRCERLMSKFWAVIISGIFLHSIIF